MTMTAPTNPLYAYSLSQSKAKEMMEFIRNKSKEEEKKQTDNGAKYLKTNVLPYDLGSAVSSSLISPVFTHSTVELQTVIIAMSFVLKPSCNHHRFEGNESHHAQFT